MYLRFDFIFINTSVRVQIGMITQSLGVGNGGTERY